MWTFAIRAIRKDLKEIILGTLSIVMGLVLCMAFYYTLIIYVDGGHYIVLSLFWFCIIPFTTLFLVNKFSRRKNPLVEALSGLILFYGFVAFMVTNHLEDVRYFSFALSSVGSNMLFVAIFILIKNYLNRPRKEREIL
ncbi:MAG: hypothetical protein JXR07_03660 [Reichenbachiella sp.]